MTEQEWVECTDPDRMLSALGEKSTDRKCGLLACACCRRIQHLCCPNVLAPLLAVLEEMAEDRIDGHELRDYLDCFIDAARYERERVQDSRHISDLFSTLDAALRILQVQLPESPVDRLTPVMLESARACIDHQGIKWVTDEQYDQEYERALVKARSWQAPLIRCVFPPPQQASPVSPDWLAWNGGTLPRIAQAIYEERAFDRMPILADALEDAGCSDQVILDHCRGPGEHVKGCWVVDLILGKK